MDNHLGQVLVYLTSRLPTEQLQLIPSLGGEVKPSRRLVFTTPGRNKPNWTYFATITLPKRGAQSTATVRDILKRAKVPEQIGISLQLKIEF
nr:ribosomal protein S16 [Dryopteris sieboldii]